MTDVFLGVEDLLELRCAVVLLMTADGDLDDCCTTAEIVPHKRFPFAPVREAVSTYDPADTFCVVLAREGNVTAMVAPREADDT